MSNTEHIPELISYLVKAGQAAPSADNSQPWCFEWNGEYLSLLYDKNRCGNALLNLSSPASWLALGAVAENLVSAASAVQAKVEWSFPLLEAGSNICVQGKFNTLAADITPSASQHPLFNRHTNRFSYKDNQIKADILHEIAELSEGGAYLKIYNDKQTCSEIASLIKSASAIRFRIKEVHEWFAKTLRFTPEQVALGVGLDVKTLPLPPGGQALLKYTSSWKRMNKLNQLGLYKLFAAIEAQPVARAPAIIAISSPADRGSVFNAGRLMERAWCKLNGNGIAVHPYYVLTDQLHRLHSGALPDELKKLAEKIELETGNVLGTKANELQMLFRIGYPKNDVVRSCRRDINDALITK